MIAVLDGLSDVEGDLIRTRTAEGRSRAQKRGQHMGTSALLGHRYPTSRTKQERAS
jgi:DNA invertase Pin-like site-specific DNA recombinase